MPPPPLPPPLPAVYCPYSGSPLWRGPTYGLKLGILRYPGAQRLSHLRVSPLSPRSMRSSALPEPAVSEQPSVGPQPFCLPLSVRLVDGGGGACVPQGICHATSGRRCLGNPEPCNGLSYAWGPGRRNFQIYGDTSPGCSPSGTTPTSPHRSCFMSYRPGNMSSVAGGSAPTYLPVPT